MCRRIVFGENAQDPKDSRAPKLGQAGIDRALRGKKVFEISGLASVPRQREGYIKKDDLMRCSCGNQGSGGLYEIAGIIIRNAYRRA